VSESEVFVVIIILGCDFIGRNNSDGHKIKKKIMEGKKVKEELEKLFFFIFKGNFQTKI